MIHLTSIKAGLTAAKEDLSWFLREAVFRVVGVSLLLVPVLFVALLVKVLWILR